jgi:zinc transport system substrate-binding protein
MQGADRILLNGADYEKWVPQATLPDGSVVNTSAAVSDRYIETDDAIVHSHGPEGMHSHAGVAFTT